MLPLLYWLNYNPNRGIDVVRNKIKAFAQKKVTLPPGRHKIVILDEADRYGGLPRMIVVVSPVVV